MLYVPYYTLPIFYKLFQVMHIKRYNFKKSKPSTIVYFGQAFNHQISLKYFNKATNFIKLNSSVNSDILPYITVHGFAMT